MFFYTPIILLGYQKVNGFLFKPLACTQPDRLVLCVHCAQLGDFVKGLFIIGDS